MDVAGLNGGDLFAAKPRQDDPIDHGAVVVDASLPFFWNGMLSQIVGRKVQHGRCFSDSAIVRDRIVTLQCIGENDAGTFLSFVEREQWPMLAYGFSP